MASADEDRFRVRPNPPKARSGAKPKGFVSQVLKAVSQSGAKASGARGARPASTFGRGRVAAGMAGRGLGANARRVVIKSRFVMLRRAGATAVSAHLRYIEREGVTRDGQKGQAYGADTDAADLKGFEERGRGDRHQFRFIVSPEDAVDLEDLKGFTRQLMQRMETDLETPLDWVAVDHWDTDNPHTHIVLRGWVGSERKGCDLVIAPDYMAHGMRLRASEIATEWLGPRTEAEMRRSLQREVDQQRLTSLDRQLLRQATVNIVDLTDAPGTTQGTQRQTLLRARLQRLEAMARAERIDANRWRLAPGMEQTLAAMGERGDILRTMHRAMKGEQRELVMDPPADAPVIGRIAAKGLDDELHDRPYVVVDGIDGRAHYLKLPAGTDLAGLPIGGILEAKPPAQERTVDRNKAQRHDMRKAQGLTLELRSHLSIEQQAKAMGATWLDRGLVVDGAKGPQPTGQGFGAQVREAMDQRVDFLAGQGLAERRGQRVILARNLLATLRDRELASVGHGLQQHTGKVWRPVQDGQPASGVYRQSIQLISGRFAMLDDGMSFQLVPWKPVIEQRLGQQFSAVVRGSSVTWNLGLRRGASR